MRNITGACFVITGLLLVLSHERWVRQVFADNCNYAIQAANPNPCEFDLLAQRCLANNPCQDGFAARPSMMSPCGSSVVFGVNGANLMQPNPAGGNGVSKTVDDLHCGTRVPCVVGNYVVQGTCVAGQPIADENSTGYAADCCDGSPLTLQNQGKIFVPQAGEDACPPEQ